MFYLTGLLLSSGVDIIYRRELVTVNAVRLNSIKNLGYKQLKVNVFFILMITSISASALTDALVMKKVGLSASVLGILILCLIIQTALVYFIKLIQYLISKSPSDFPLAKGLEGYTKLMESAATSNTEVVATLLQNEIDVNAIDSQGATALMFAAEAGCFDIVKLLINKDSKQNLKSETGFTAYQYAYGYESPSHKRTVSLFKNYLQVLGVTKNYAWISFFLVTLPMVTHLDFQVMLSNFAAVFSQALVSFAAGVLIAAIGYGVRWIVKKSSIDWQTIMNVGGLIAITIDVLTA
jgi:hypothetical protein